MKYSFEIKLKAVKAIKKGILIKEPYNKICRQWRDRVKHWVKIYRQNGISGLKSIVTRSPLMKKKDNEIKKELRKRKVIQYTLKKK